MRVTTCAARTIPTGTVADATLGANQLKPPSVLRTRTFCSFKPLLEKSADNWVQVIML
jgi:hypothetical protein